MKLHNGYILRKIAGVPYILPYGQNIADHRRSVKLNESGLILWNGLQKNATEAELLKLLIDYYNADSKNIPLLQSDIRSFLHQLTMAGILEKEEAALSEPSEYYFQIGTLTFGIQGPKDLIHPSFFDFACAPCQPDQRIYLIPAAPCAAATGHILVRNREITICGQEDSYIFLYPYDYGIFECHLSMDGSQAVFYCTPSYDDTITEKLFHAIRFSFLVKAQLLGMFALHSASILYHDKAWLFSAPSGTGKSTHTDIWNRLFQTPVLNGDLNLIGIENQTPVVYGTPWCGTSGIYTPKAYPLGGITLLKRGLHDQVLPMARDEQMFSVMQRLISPSWTSQMLCWNLEFTEQLLSHIPVFRLQCTKQDSAAYTMKQTIDTVCFAQ